MLRGRAWAAALLLIALGAMIMFKGAANQLNLYIHPRYTALLLASSVVLIGAGIGLLLVRAPAVHSGMLAILALPVVLGLFVPARPLGAVSVPGKSLSSGSNDALVNRWRAQLTDDSRTWTLLEWTAATRKADLAPLRDKPASFDGFVFRTADLQPDEVWVGRYIVTCCTADGTALSLRVQAPNAAAFAIDDWVRVDGLLASNMINGEAKPLIIGTLTAIDTPDVPYLYP